MFTNQEVRAAMQGLVDKVGENHRSYGRYADPATGKGACFLGALCEYMGLAVPAEGTAPGFVIGDVSKDMQIAFVVAQAINDSLFEWKYVLMGVDEVLAGRYDKGPYAGCPCGCVHGANVSHVMEKVRARRAFDRARTPNVTVPQAPMYASGGIVAPTNLSVTLGSITIDYSLMTGINSFPTVFKEEGLVKKDHALVA